MWARSVGQAVDVASARISLEKVCIPVLNCFIMNIQLMSRVDILGLNSDIPDSEESDNEHSKKFYTNCLQ